MKAARGPGSNARTQREEILAELRRRRRAGSPWVSHADFPQIHNITPRISELRKSHQIVTARGPDGVARYRLAWDLGDEGVPIKQLVADARAELARPLAAEPLSLFEIPPAAPANALCWDEAVEL